MDLRRVLSSPELRSRVPSAVRSQVGWLFYRGAHRFLDVAMFESGLVETLDRATLIERCREHDRVWSIGESEAYQLSDLIDPEIAPASLNTCGRSVHLAAPFVCELPETTLFGPDAIARTADGGIVLETTENGDETLDTGNCKRNLFWNLVAHHRNAGPPASDDRIVCPLVDPWARGYFHWIVDSLTKLEGLERYAKETGMSPTPVIPESPSSWMRRSLKLTGWDPDACLQWDGTSRTFDRVVVPSIRRRNSTPSIEAVRWLRDRMTANADPPSTSWSRRIYISRREAANRQVLNEPALESELERLGFETYALEELSVDEQVALFSQADAILGLHGAGFTNLIFATDATVIELFGSTVHSTVYHHLASGLGFRYGAIQCPSMDRNVVVDPERVTGAVEQMLE